MGVSKGFRILKWTKKKGFTWPPGLLEKSAGCPDLKIWNYLQKRGHVIQNYEEVTCRMIKHLNLEKYKWLEANKEKLPNPEIISESLVSTCSFELAKYLVDKGDQNWCASWDPSKDMIDPRLLNLVESCKKKYQNSLEK